MYLRELLWMTPYSQEINIAEKGGKHSLFYRKLQDEKDYELDEYRHRKVDCVMAINGVLVIKIYKN